MKNLFFISLFILTLASCGQSRKERMESLRVQDSIEDADAAREYQLEQARIDSLRRDSIAKSETAPLAEIHRGSVTYVMFPHGKLNISDRCLKGEYEERAGGEYYVLDEWTNGSNYCGDGWGIFLIVGNSMYLIDYGSAGIITNFVYSSGTNTITITEIDGERANTENLDFAGYSSPVVPLSSFEKVGSVTWLR